MKPEQVAGQTEIRKRQGIHQIIVPEANHGDVDELPEYVKEGVNFHFASHFRDVAKILFPPV
jgi:ATP-dependent Lon protease